MAARQSRRDFFSNASILMAGVAGGLSIGVPVLAQTSSGQSSGAAEAPNQFVESNGRKLAYRSIGEGSPLVLCTRFRGNMDFWDPAFLDQLAELGFRVITFDYTGLGLSTGAPNYEPPALAQDAHDLIEALGLEKVVLGGWSLGGLAAQVFLAKWPDRLSQLVLIGTGPPGQVVLPPEQLFYDTATREHNSLEDEIVLFFEPSSTASREAAIASHNRIARRTAGRSKPVPIKFAADYLGSKPRNPIFPALPVLDALKATGIPVLHIGGDHDISFRVENWYALNGQLPTLQLLTFPRTGHAPQHQHPEQSALAIRNFVDASSG